MIVQSLLPENETSFIGSQGIGAVVFYHQNLEMPRPPAALYFLDYGTRENTGSV
jgi:hypothetical protein